MVTDLATIAEVTAVTGETVTQTNIDVAVNLVALATGIDMDADTNVDDLTDAGFRARDVRLLRSAIRWQAAYLKNNPTILAAAGNVTGAAANGVSVTYGDGGSAGALVGPLARLALNRLSWRRSRAILLKRVPPRPYALQTMTEDGSSSDWTPEGPYAR